LDGLPRALELLNEIDRVLKLTHFRMQATLGLRREMTKYFWIPVSVLSEKAQDRQPRAVLSGK
jgi:hypothetical protein